MSLRVPPPRQFYIGLDLGKLRDFSAIVALERFSTRAGRDPVWVHDLYRWTNTVRSAERLRLGTSYPRVIDRVRDLVVQAAPLGPVTLAVDSTGVGQPVVDALRDARLPCTLLPVTITAGEHAGRTPRGWNVPKRELIVNLQMMIARRELALPADLTALAAIIGELSSLTRKLEAEAGRHDDLALALALAAWPLRNQLQIGDQPYPLLL
jgi:hypothetical protein